MSRVPHWLGQAAGVSNPEIPDLTRKRPQPYRHDREAFVPGGEFSSLWECDSFGIMKVSGLNTPAGIHARIPASSGARSRPRPRTITALIAEPRAIAPQTAIKAAGPYRVRVNYPRHHHGDRLMRRYRRWQSSATSGRQARGIVTSCGRRTPTA